MLQIIGTTSSRDTQKAVRFCKERRIPFQFVDLRERTLSEREWESVFACGSPLIDEESQYYRKNGYSYREYDEKEEVKEHPELLILPILRCGGKAVVGLDTSFLEKAGC